VAAAPRWGDARSRRRAQEVGHAALRHDRYREIQALLEQQERRHQQLPMNLGTIARSN
jgi:hypothetical protein